MSLKTESRTLESPTTTRLGAHPDGSGASFGLFSSVADAVELCLFDDAGQETRWGLEQGEGFVWQGYLPDATAGTAVRLSCARPVGPVAGRALQPGEAAVGPVCPCGCR